MTSKGGFIADSTRRSRRVRGRGRTLRRKTVQRATGKGTRKSYIKKGVKGSK